MTLDEARVWVTGGRDESWPDEVFLEIATRFPEVQYENVHHRLLRRHLQARADGRDVLDAGCSTGLLCEAAARHGARSVIGLDVGAERLHKARLRLKPYAVASRFDTADLQERWPLDSAQVDLVVSSEVIEHLRPERRMFFLAEAARVLRPAGTLIVTTPNAERWFAGSAVATGQWNPHEHWGEFTGPGLLSLCRDVGFDARVTYYRYPKVNRWIRRYGHDRLADLIERVPPQRKLAMNLLAVGVRGSPAPSMGVR